jgi:hypothetical protein
VNNVWELVEAVLESHDVHEDEVTNAYEELPDRLLKDALNNPGRGGGDNERIVAEKDK